MRAMIPLAAADFDFELSDTGPIVAYLTEHPDELPDFQQKVWGMMAGLMSWGDYRSPGELANMMLDVCAEVARQTRAHHIPRVKASGNEPMIGGKG